MIQEILMDVSVDPFYSDANMAYLREVISQIDSGKAILAEHVLIEELDGMEGGIRGEGEADG